MEDYRLIDNTEEHCYEFHIGGYRPLIEYMKPDDYEIFLTHTRIPEAIQGRGIGTQLVRKVLQDIERQNLLLVPMCAFVIDYIRKHPEWNKIVRRL